MSDEKRAPCPTCGSGDRKRLFSACTHYGTLDPWHFESDRPVLPVPAYVAYSGKIAGISDKVDLTENSSLAVAGRAHGVSKERISELSHQALQQIREEPSQSLEAVHYAIEAALRESASQENKKC